MCNFEWQECLLLACGTRFEKSALAKRNVFDRYCRQLYYNNSNKVTPTSQRLKMHFTDDYLICWL
jgi:hypothetical protein